MKTAIVYVSTHHGNTKKLCDAIRAADDGVVLIDGTEETGPALAAYDRIGFAAGIDNGSFYRPMLALMRACLPEGKDVFLLYTCGMVCGGYADAAEKIVRDSGCRLLGTYGCTGWDTSGAFRLMGGVAKGHPDAGEIAGAVAFYHGLKG